MLVILATNQLGLGGSETYLLTVAEQLDRLGHEPLVYTPEPGAGARIARDRGIAVVGDSQLPGECDAVLVQDAGVSLELASRYPRTAQVFVAHSESLDLQSPPQLGGTVSAVVALNERVAARMRALALQVEVVRLRQPIDTERFVPQGALPEKPRRLLLLSSNSVDDRLGLLEKASAAAGLKLAHRGASSARGQTPDPRSEIAAADIVVGYGRSILEAMACGRAAYVYDRHGGDGWVTASTYPELEADGFGGRGERVTVNAARLREDLAGYSASMGPVNHDLAIAHHRAGVHAQRLVELLRRLSPVDRPPNAPLREMARLVRLEWRARVDAQSLAIDNARLFAEARRLEDERRKAVEAATAQTARRYETTRSWRFTAPLRAIGAFPRQVLGLLRRKNSSSDAAQVVRVDSPQDIAVEPPPSVEEADGLHPETQVP